MSLPWFSHDLTNLVHEPSPGRLFGLISSTGVGKTLFDINAVSRWLEEGAKVCVVPTEEAERYVVLLACRAAGVSYRDFFYQRTERAADVVRWVAHYQEHALLDIVGGKEPTLGELLEALEGGVPDVLVVDHIHGLDREGRPLPAFLDLVMSTLSELAASLSIPIVFFAQIHRPQSRDPLYPYRIPTLHSGLASPKIEQATDIVLGLSRKLQDDVDKKTMERIAKGLLHRGESVRDYEESNTARVTVLKHRVDDDARGRSLLLTVRDGKMQDRLAVVDGTQTHFIGDDDPPPF